MKSSRTTGILSKNLSPARWACAFMMLLFGLSLSQAQTTVITFEEPELAVGPVAAITKGGVTVRFITAARIFRPDVATQSPPNALVNAGQDMNDETGFQKPFIFEFDHLQRRVRVSVGLNMNDPSLAGFPDPSIEARLIGYDAAGNQLAISRSSLGAIGTPITTSLEVQMPGDSIQRVKLEFTGNVAEVLDNLEFESGSATVVAADTVSPEIIYLSPGSEARINSRTVRVQGRVREANGLSLTVNGATTPVRRYDAYNYEFITTITLPEASSRVDLRAIDDAGNVGELHRDLDLRIPASFQVLDLRFTQSGLLDAGSPTPTRLVAKKTGLFRLAPQIRTADGRETFVDSAQINLLSGSITVATFPGQRRLATGGFYPFGSELGDGQRAYFFVDGRRLMPRYAIHFVLQLFVQGRMVHEEPLGGDWNFPLIQGLSLLLAPQQHSLDADHFRALMNILANFARMYPVPDGVVSLNSDTDGGIRFAMLPPNDYAGHTDPNDPGVAAIAYDQAFLLHDHNVGMESPGPDTIFGSTDDPFMLWSGEYLPINTTAAEDANRNGRFDEDELARVRGGDLREGIQRSTNWTNFVATNAESQRQNWNRAHSSNQQSRRAVVPLISEYPASAGNRKQNRTGWLGAAAAGQTAFWLSIDLTENASLPHEVGHTWGIAHTPNNHTDGNADGATCNLSGETINLLTRQVINPGQSMMCRGVGNSANYFMMPSEYNEIFDRLLGGEEQRIAASRSPLSPETGQELNVYRDRSFGFSKLQSAHHQGSRFRTSPGVQAQSFVLIGTLSNEDKANIFESYMSATTLTPTAEAKDSPYTMVFLDGNGGSLGESPFGVSFQSPDLPVKLLSTTFSIVRRLPAGTAVVQLRKQGQTLIKIVRSEHAPVVTNVTVSQSKDAKDVINVQWEGSDEDGDALTYAVGYSIDQGKTFIPLRGGVNVSRMGFSTLGLAGNKQALIQVMASDGFNTVETNSTSFALPTAAPNAFILAPDSKTLLAADESIILRGTALDPEDGILSGKSLRWFLLEPKGARPLGDDSEVTIKGLPAGRYTLRLTATDQDGQQASDERSVLITNAKLAGQLATDNFRVTEASLTAGDAGMSGPCPMKVVFNGYITANGPGTVKYTFTRSDGATAPAYAMEFKQAGRQAVSTDWTLGDARVLPHFEGWQVIKILSPNELQSERALFSVTCFKETPSQNNEQNATSVINSLTAAVGEPSPTSQGRFIACPVKETRTEVTTPLPKPWWNTPQIGELERVNVQTIGGNRTLVCEYWAYGRTVSIMRRFPEGATDCSAEGNGFLCH